MDYDYESFVRHSESGREVFLSIWDDPKAPENYLEVTASAEDADAVAASVSERLSQEYELLKESRELDRAGRCIRIEASELKGTGRMADQLQAVYIIPAPDGCRVAAAHFSLESAEGFGRRFAYMLAGKKKGYRTNRHLPRSRDTVISTIRIWRAWKKPANTLFIGTFRRAMNRRS